MQRHPNGLPKLGQTTRDVHVEWARGIVSLFPGIGPILSTVIGVTVPNLRLERIEDFLTSLAKTIDEMKLANAAQTEHGATLIEEGIRQSATALSKDRRSRIETLVVKGLKDLGSNGASSQQFLRLINQLDDEDLALLLDIHLSPRNPMDSLGSAPGTPEPTEVELLSQGIKTVQENRLASLGLLIRTVGPSWRISPAGVAFLKYLELIE